MDNIYINAMQRALNVARNSPDRSTQNGAVTVNYGKLLTEACNEYPLGVKLLEERFERPLKYAYIEHAERNAIFKAAKSGAGLNGGALVCPWAACQDCARAIIQAGLKTLVRMPFSDDDTNARWYESCMNGDTMMREAGLNIVEYTFPEVTIPFLLRDGNQWNPVR